MVEIPVACEPRPSRMLTGSVRVVEDENAKEALPRKKTTQTRFSVI